MAPVNYLGRIFKPVGRTSVVDRPVGRTGVVDRPAGRTGVVDRLTVDGVGGHGEVRKSDNRSFARREMNSILKFSMLTSMIIFGGRFGMHFHGTESCDRPPGYNISRYISRYIFHGTYFTVHFTVTAKYTVKYLET